MSTDFTPCVLELERAVGASRVESDPDLCAPFARDESETEGVVPAAVVHAESAEDVSRALAVCAAQRVPVYPRAAGTGRTGGAVPTRKGVVLDTTRLRAIKDIDRRNQLAVIEPGVITGALHEAVEREGLFYPPDPSSLAECTMGGNIAENAGGPRAFKYGVTRDYVLGLEAVLMDGTRLRAGKRTVKGVTGYDVTALLVGSEGTLAVFTEATLRLVPNPPEVRTLLAYFRTALDAGEAVAGVVARGLVPRCLELLDRECCAAVRATGQAQIPEAADALLLIEVDGEGAALDLALERVGGACADARALDVVVAKHGTDRDRLWAARRVMSRALRARAKFKLSEDIVVPRTELCAMLARVGEIAQAHGVRLPAYGHAGDGNLHVNFLWDRPEDKPRVERAILEVFKSTVAFGGTLTGEHGLGALKMPYLPLEQSDELIALQTRIKSVFDPHNLLNPGKMFPPPGHRPC